MRQTKRRFVALSTALAMALVLVASLVPSFGAKAADYNRINNLAFDFTSPNAGDSVTLGGDSGYDPSMIPAISTTTEGMKHYESDTDPIPGGRFVKDSINSLEDYYNASGPEEKLFVGTFESGKTYKAVVYGNADMDAGYALADDVNVSVNGATIVDESIDNNIEWGYSGVYMLISFTIGGGESGGDDTSSVTVKDGYADQTVAPGSAITIGFDTAITNFVNGTEQGLVYIDGTQVPSQYITATEGSTIITVAQEYLSQLAEGAHTMVVKFLDGSEGQASFTISSSAAASSAANGTSGTAATTTKVTSPKTADVLPIAGIALVFVGATAIGVIAIRRKNL